MNPSGLDIPPAIAQPCRQMSSIWQRLLRFGLVGVLVALLDVALIWILLHWVPRLLAVAIAYPFAVSAHFALNRCWVFSRSRVPLGDQLWRYGLTAGACWLCTVGVAAASLALLSGDVFVAKAMAIPPATLLGFVLMQRFVFPTTPPASAAE
jgi:putative flippase GtrA